MCTYSVPSRFFAPEEENKAKSLIRALKYLFHPHHDSHTPRAHPPSHPLFLPWPLCVLLCERVAPIRSVVAGETPDFFTKAPETAALRPPTHPEPARRTRNLLGKHDKDDAAFGKSFSAQSEKNPFSALLRPGYDHQHQHRGGGDRRKNPVFLQAASPLSIFPRAAESRIALRTPYTERESLSSSTTSQESQRGPHSPPTLSRLVSFFGGDHFFSGSPTSSDGRRRKAARKKERKEKRNERRMNSGESEDPLLTPTHYPLTFNHFPLVSVSFIWPPPLPLMSPLSGKLATNPISTSPAVESSTGLLDIYLCPGSSGGVLCGAKGRPTRGVIVL